MNLDQELSKALRRQQPRADLAPRVLATIERGGRGRTRGWTAWSVRIRALAVAAVLLLAVVGFTAARQSAERRQRQREEQAARQVMLALRIASESLNDAMRSVRP